MHLGAGTKVEHYEVVAMIGAGGMGEVYRAHDARLGRDVAVKLLPAQLRSDPDRLRRFEKEARTAGALNHPGLLSVFELGVHDGNPYLVTELLDGTSLADKLRGGRLPVRKAIDYATQIALALASAHDAGIVHRDIKPANLFVTTDGRVKILDFGIAKALELPADPVASTMTANVETAEGSILGTAGYMAPEQVRGGALDHRADIFALGIVLYEMLSGTAPFDRPRSIDRAIATLDDEPPALATIRPEIPPALELIVRRCIEKDRAQRFQSARDVAFALQALSAETGALPRVRGRPRRWIVLVLAGVALAAAGAVFVVGREAVRDRAAASDQASPGVRFERITHRTGRITRARYAPDDKTIIFSAQFDGDTWKLYSTEPGNPDFRVLIDDEAFLLDVSRTGDLALLLPDKGRLRLARAPLAGGAPRVLLDSVIDATWAPDGSLIASIDGKDAARIEAPIGTPILEGKAAGGPPLRFNLLDASPDGERVAHLRYVSGGGLDALGVVDRRGVHRTLVPAAIFLGLAWRPDGREIWFARDHGLFATTLDGRQRQVLEVPGPCYLHAIAADGRALISLERRPVRLIGHIRDQPERELTWHDGGFPVAISYDGKLLLIVEFLASWERAETYVRSTDGKPAIHLGSALPLALSPDGAWALVAGADLPSTTLTLVPTEAGQNRSLALGPIVQASMAVFFPDGKRIAIGGHASGKPERIWVTDVSGAAPPRPIGPEGVGLLRAISPDGTKVLGRVIATQQTVVIAVADGSSQPLPELVGRPLAWSADGKSIYVYVDDWRDGFIPLPNAYVATFDLATRRTTRLPGFPGQDPGSNVELAGAAITPDGSSYVYGSLQFSSTLYQVTGLR